MIDGLGTHSLGSMPMLHQLVCRQEGRIVFSFPPSRDRAEAERGRRRQKMDEAEHRAECEAEGMPYVETLYSVVTTSADLFA